MTGTSGGSRAARGEDGKTYDEPEDVTYEKWINRVKDGIIKKQDKLASRKLDGLKRLPPIAASIVNEKIKANQKPHKYKGVKPDVNFICELDKELYKDITDDIVGNEVIITNIQIVHINERHPNVYEKIKDNLPTLIKEPDYIIQSKRKATAIVLKDIEEKHYQAILRLHTSKDNPGYKNSIITLLKIDNDERERLIRNKKVVYKSK